MTKLKEEDLKNVNGGVDSICGEATVGSVVGNVTNSDNTDVTGTSYVGGICGEVADSSSVINCYSNCEIDNN